MPAQSVEAIVRAFCFFGRETLVYFRLRPSLPDPGDEFLLELAVAGRADAIVTHNVRHLAAADHLSVEEFVSILLANRVASREFIDSRARLFDRTHFDRALDRIPDVEPEDYDRL